MYYTKNDFNDYIIDKSLEAYREIDYEKAANKLKSERKEISKMKEIKDKISTLKDEISELRSEMNNVDERRKMRCLSQIKLKENQIKQHEKYYKELSKTQFSTT